MKNLKSLTIELFLLSTGIVYGQTNRFDLGIEGSPSLTFLLGNDFIDNNHTPPIGFSGDLFIQFNFTNLISLLTNFSYEIKGSVLTSY